MQSGLYFGYLGLVDGILARMKQLYREAGLPADGFPQSAAAAAKDWAQGSPWPNVDYTKVQACLFLERHHLYAAHLCLTKLVMKGKTNVRAEIVAASTVTEPALLK